MPRNILSAVFLLAAAPLLVEAAKETDTHPAPSTQIAQVSSDLASPRDTLKTFFLHAEQLVHDKSNRSSQIQLYKTLDIPETVGEQRKPIAVQLLGVLNHIGNINSDELAPGVEEIQELKLTLFEFFPDNPSPKAQKLFKQVIKDVGSAPPGRIAFTKTESGEWKFSEATLNNITVLWSWIEERGVKTGADIREINFTQKIRSKYVPDILKGRFVFGAELWQWVGLIVVLIVVLLVNAFLAIVFRPIANLIAKKATGDSHNIEVHKAIDPIGLFVAAAMFWLSLDVIGFVGVTVLMLVVAIKLVVGYALARLVWAIVDVLSVVWRCKLVSQDSTLSRIIIPLLARTVKVLIVVFAAIYAASALDINLLPLLGSLGIAGLAISFAAQDTVRNLFGSVMIFTDKPFNIGELIQYGNYSGIVEHIGFRSSKIRTRKGHLVTIPNGSLTGDAVENISARKTIQHMMNIVLPLNMASSKLNQAMQIIQNIFESKPLYDSVHNTIDGNELNPKIVFKEINMEGYQIRIVYWYSPADYFSFLDYNQKVNIKIIEEFEKADIQFAVPARQIRGLENTNIEMTKS